MRRRHHRGMIRLGLALLVFAPVLELPIEVAAYNCSPSNHCYGTVEWNGGVNGATVKISVNSDAYMNTSNWFITNELWLREDLPQNPPQSDQCYISGVYTDPWMEAGMIARGGQLRYFWNRCPPGGTYFTKLLNLVPSGDYNTLTYFKINRSDFNPNDYKIWIASATLGTMTGYSYGNTMSPNRIQIGQELGASSGGHWGSTGFYESRYIQGSNYYYQFWGGNTLVSDNPPLGYWQITPAPGNQGGLWRTYCQC